GLLKLTSDILISGYGSNKEIVLKGDTSGKGELAGAINDPHDRAGKAVTSLTKAGSGTVTLSGSNTSTGAIIVTGGTLRLSQPTALSASTEVRLSSVAKADLAFTGTQAVKALVLNGVGQPDGFYGASNLSGYLSGTGLLLLGKPYFLIDPYGDPDGDGLNNLLEYALASGDPARPNASIAPVGGTAIVGGTSYLTLTYSKRAATYGLTYAVETSSDLIAWSTTGTVIVSTSGDTVTVRDGTPLRASSPKRFIRLKITLF
ncbi:MAG: autotransporter-associated beta strand repeat-containing protein, partial [Verrucomicrobiota bacterium]